MKKLSHSPNLVWCSLKLSRSPKLTFVFLLLLSWWNLGFAASPEIHSGVLRDRILWNTGTEHRVASRFEIASGAELVVEKGVKISFDAGASLIVKGVLKVQGSDSPEGRVVFGSSSAQLWGGVIVEPGASLDMTSILVRNSQSCFKVIGSKVVFRKSLILGCVAPGVSVEGGVVRLEDSEIGGGSESGMFIQNSESRDSYVTIVRSVIRDNAKNGVEIVAGVAAISESRILNNGALGISASTTDPMPPLRNVEISGNYGVARLPISALPSESDHCQFRGTHEKILRISGGRLDGQLELPVYGMGSPFEIRDFYVEKPFKIAREAKLIVGPARVFRFAQGAGIVVRGLLDVDGSPVQPVLFSSMEDYSYSPNPARVFAGNGSWQGIEVLGSGRASFRYAQIRYAGATDARGVAVSGAAVSGAAVSVQDKGYVDFEKSQIFGSGGAGIATYGGSLKTFQLKFLANAGTAFVGKQATTDVEITETDSIANEGGDLPIASGYRFLDWSGSSIASGSQFLRKGWFPHLAFLFSDDRGVERASWGSLHEKGEPIFKGWERSGNSLISRISGIDAHSDYGILRISKSRESKMERLFPLLRVGKEYFGTLLPVTGSQYFSEYLTFPGKRVAPTQVVVDAQKIDDARRIENSDIEMLWSSTEKNSDRIVLYRRDVERNLLGMKVNVIQANLGEVPPGFLMLSGNVFDVNSAGIRRVEVGIAENSSPNFVWRPVSYLSVDGNWSLRWAMKPGKYRVQMRAQDWLENVGEVTGEMEFVVR